MIDIIKSFLRHKAIKTYRSRFKSGFMPIGRMKSAAVILDVEDPAYEECKNVVTSFFKANGIKVEFYFMDLRRIAKDELLLTSIPNTVIRRDLNWYEMPSVDKLESLMQVESGRYDLLVSLVPHSYFPLEFMVKISTARFKVGIAPLKDNPYDMVVSCTEQTNCIDMFNEIKNYLLKIG